MPKKKSQRSLEKWTKEKWGTSDGKPAERKTKSGKKVTTRYLPKAAWSQLSESEKKATNEKKKRESQKGKQFVANTKKAKSAGKRARGQ